MSHSDGQQLLLAYLVYVLLFREYPSGCLSDNILMCRLSGIYDTVGGGLGEGNVLLVAASNTPEEALDSLSYI